MTQIGLPIFARSLYAGRQAITIATVLFTAVGSDLLVQEYAHFSSPGLFLLPAIAISGMIGGLGGALTAAAVSIAFVALMNTLPVPASHGSSDRFLRLCVLSVSAPSVALVVGLLHRRGERTRSEELRSEREESAERARRFELEKASLLSQDQLSRQRANDLISSIPGIVWEASLQGTRLRVSFVSSYAEQLLSYPARQWAETPNFWLEIVHPEDRDEVARRVDTICNFAGGMSGVDSVPLEYRWLDKEGMPVWVETRLVRLMNGNRCVGFRAVTLDINDRKRLEQALRDRVVELGKVSESLKQSNDELDQFAFVASHDLKAPLRGIANLSHWIEEDLGDRFTPEAREQTRLLLGRVNRMEALIDGLLEYSHVGRTRGDTVQVDTAALLTEVIDWIAAPPEIRFTIEPGMPIMQADRLRLQQVFTNLLGNAVKHHGKPEGHIIVRCNDSGSSFKFSVIDDGQGIDPRYHERIFGIFQTLVPRDQVEGTGIGLALVKKVVSSKGGSVCVESEYGRGATFSFTWPKVEGQP